LLRPIGKAQPDTLSQVEHALAMILGIEGAQRDPGARERARLN
jgi:hypothetical protein